MSYKTKQNELIREFLEENPNKHITVNDIFIHLEKNEKKVGVATIYRQLEKLVEEGIVAKYNIDNNSSACFEYLGEGCKNEHFHLKCSSCGKLIHLECNEIKQAIEHIYSHHKFQIDPYRTVFYGLCEECTFENTKNAEGEKNNA